MNIRPKDTSKSSDDLQIAIYRKMTPQERLKQACELYRVVKQIAAEGVRMRHPDYTEKQVHLAVIRMSLPEDLFLAAYPHSKEILP